MTTEKDDRSPEWSDHGGMVEQQHSAMESLKHHHAQREKAQAEPGREGLAPEQPQVRSFSELKAEQAKAITEAQESSVGQKQEGERKKPTFFEDRHPQHGLGLGHSR